MLFNSKKIISLYLGIFLAISCGQEEFSTNKVRQSSTSNPIQTSTVEDCASSTHIKPDVDFLFLWDNSSSQLVTPTALKEALANTINLVATGRFDYRMMLTTLIDTGNDPKYIVTENPDGLSSTAQALVIPQGQAPDRLSSFSSSSSAQGSREAGLDRVTQVINQWRGHGVFRQKAYLIIVIMSGGDDNSYLADGEDDSGPKRDAHINQKVSELISLRDNTLQNIQMRFMSLVAHDSPKTCGSGFKQNYVYRETSKRIYNQPYSNSDQNPTDQGDRSKPDSYNVCNANYKYLFDGINNSIQDVTLHHVYDHWPISSNRFDPSKISVRKNTGRVLYENDPDGFEYIDYQTNKNTRIEPSPGEPYTGYMIKLNGDGKVTHPECLIVQTQTPADYYGYVHLHSKPSESTIRLRIDGVDVPRADTNSSQPSGWEYIGHFSSLNIKVKSPQEPNQPGSPAENKTGYFLKLYGSQYIYSNSSVIEANYDPATVQ